jgi:hypothetical protein
MAEVYINDSGGDRVPIEVAIDKLTPFEKKYYDAPPDVKGDHVVLKVAENEINAVFPQEGYYHLPGLTPDDCRGLFGIQ